jgi:hypothetical protein
MIVRLLVGWFLDAIFGRADKPISAPSTAPRTPCPAYAAQTGRRAA